MDAYGTARLAAKDTESAIVARICEDGTRRAHRPAHVALGLQVVRRLASRLSAHRNDGRRPAPYVPFGVFRPSGRHGLLFACYVRPAHPTSPLVIGRLAIDPTTAPIDAEHVLGYVVV